MGVLLPSRSSLVLDNDGLRARSWRPRQVLSRALRSRKPGLGVGSGRMLEYGNQIELESTHVPRLARPPPPSPRTTRMCSPGISLYSMAAPFAVWVLLVLSKNDKMKDGGGSHPPRSQGARNTRQTRRNETTWDDKHILRL